MPVLPPTVRKERYMARLELEWLRVKERLFGKLSPRDEARRKELLRKMSVIF